MNQSDHARLARRRFLQLLAASGAGVLGGCRTTTVPSTEVGAPTATTASSVSEATASTTPSPAAPVTTINGSAARSARTLVVVQMNGGNDGLNTVVPDDGRYRDARPTLAIPEGDLVRLGGLDGFGLHPALGPLSRLWDDGRLGIIEAIGFPNPDRSHFVAMDSWWTADAAAGPGGWLGRALDGIEGDLDPLYALALGAGAPVLRGSVHRPVEIVRSADFRFADDLDLEGFAALGGDEPADALWAAAAASYGVTVEAVERFAALVGAGDADDDLVPAREGGASLTDGLATAASLIAAGGPSRLIVVSSGGFDTHAGQLTAHQELLADLAGGVDGFFAQLEGAGVADDVMLVAVSEFGRRVGENASGGTDHGKAGVAFAVGAGVAGGLHGRLDLADLDDGDVRSSVDPRSLFTACLDWIGRDATQVLGRRYDEVTLLR